MIRDEDLQPLVATIAATIVGPIMAELQTDSARGAAKGLVEMLDRLSSDLTDGDRIAASALDSLERLESELPFPASAPTPRAPDPRPLRYRVDDRMTALQDMVGQPASFDALVGKLAAGEAAARDWLREASMLLARFNRDMEASFEARDDRPPISLGGSKPDELRRRLASYLRARFAGLPEDPIAAFSLVPGGNSKLTALFRILPNDHLPEALALRVDIPDSITGARLEDEYPILKRVHALGLPVPEPLLFEPDPARLGGAFVIMPQILDVQIAGSPFNEDRRRYGSAMGPDFGVEAARVFAMLHGRTLEPSRERPDLAAKLATIIDALIGEWRTFEHPSLSISLDLGVAWMLAHPLSADRPLCLVHGDAAPHNFLTRDGHAIALLDWELAKLGDPAEDIAQIRMMLIDGVIEWDDFVRAYVEAGGPPSACDPHAVAYYQLLTYFKHGVNQTRLRNKFLRGERTDLSAALVASHYQDRVTLYQALALEEATELDFADVAAEAST